MMQPIIVENLRLDGRVASRTRTDDDRLRIGRAYDNDVILDDRYVSPHHAELYRDENDHWFTRDRDSVNGTWHSRSGWLGSDQCITSGDEVCFGHSRVRLIFPGHEVAPTLRDTPRPRWLSSLDRPLVAIVALATAAAVTGYVQTLDATEVPGWADWAAPAATALLTMLIWAGVWAMAGTVIRHRFMLAGQAAAAGLAWLAADALHFGSEYVQFWTNGQTVASALFPVGAALLGGTLIYTGLLLATQMRWRRALTLAQGTAWALLATLVIIQAADEPDFSTRPDYAAELKPPLLSWQPAGKPETFSEAVDESFERLE